MMLGSLLTPLEIVSGVVFDENRRLSALPGGVSGEDVITVLERAILPALQRPPCVVSFSGGRDSSIVLAVASRLARREGLPLPIPATNRFPLAEASDESDWQERVVASLGLSDWHRLVFTHELDAVGPVATGVLRSHGLLWPSNAHFHVPLLEAAAGGSLLTGAGGDEVFGPSQWSRATEVLGGRARPEARDLLRIGFALSPPRVRQVFLGRRIPEGWSWLRPPARRAVVRGLAAGAAREPMRWQRRLQWIRGFRYLEMGLSSLGILAEDAGVKIVHPLIDPGFVSSLAHLPRDRRFADRTSAMTLLFGGLLPDEVLTREGKAQFDGSFWTDHSRALIARWNGEGVDSELVDVEALRKEWSSESPSAASFTLLQSVWLALERARRSASVGEPLQKLASGSRH